MVRAPRRPGYRRRRPAWRRRYAGGFGSVFGTFGARTAASAPTFPCDSSPRNRANERMPAKPRISERPPMPSARRAAMNARTSCGVSLASSASVGAAAQMLGDEGEELPDVALVGFDGFGRHPALGPEMREPARHLGRHVVGGEGEFVRWAVGVALVRRLISDRPTRHLHSRWMRPSREAASLTAPGITSALARNMTSGLRISGTNGRARHSRGLRQTPRRPFSAPR